jgi:hypothetical protein
VLKIIGIGHITRLAHLAPARRTSERGVQFAPNLTSA